MKKRSKKRKPSELTKLKKRLARLQSDIATVTSEITKKKLLVQILLAEEKIKIEEFHKVLIQEMIQNPEKILKVK